MKRILKIAYVITRSDVIGGASVHVLDLALGAQSAGHDVAIFVGGEGIFIERARAVGLKCTTVKSLVREISPVMDVKCFFELRKKIADFSPSVIHLHSSKAGIVGRLVARSLGVPAIFTAHGWAFTEGVSPKRRIMYRFIESVMARMAAKIITVSDYDKNLALRSKVADAQKIVTIHNGMPAVQANVRCPEDRRNQPIRLIMVARFEKPKNQMLLLECLAQTRSRSWLLELVGDGPEMQSVKSWCSELGLDDRVTFSGARNDVAARLATSDVFVLISNWEGLPLTILEAMRGGIPVLASAVGGVPEAVLHMNTGLLVDNSNKEEIVQSLDLIISSEPMRDAMGRQGRKCFEDGFTFEMMLKSTLDVYVHALHGARGDNNA